MKDPPSKPDEQLKQKDLEMNMNKFSHEVNL
jgi:hypothetical protein